MVKVVSTIHHGLRLPALGVKFRDGEADVDERLVPQVLRFAYLGVQLPDEETTADEDAGADDGDAGSDDEDPGSDGQPDETDAAQERPSANASRKDWAAYAARLGVPVADDAKRDEIRALFD